MHRKRFFAISMARALGGFRRMLWDRAVLLLLALVMSGCALSPRYERPEVAIPTQWRMGDTGVFADAQNQWWHGFEDPALNQLVEQALENNKDLHIASARVEEYLGRFSVTRSEQFPQAGAEAAGDRTRTPATRSASGRASTGETYQASVLLSFELDLFGRLRHATAAARAELLASEEGHRTVLIAVITAVIQNYIQLLELDKELEIAKRTLDTRKESLRISRLRFNAGLTSEMDMQQAQVEYQSTLTQIPTLEAATAQRETAIALLLGGNPAPVTRGGSLDRLSIPQVPAGLPSALLERRPDLRQAEQQLKAAAANVRVAKLAYFPVISLTGLLGYVSPQLADLFQGPSRTWSYGGGISVPIFTAGKIAGQVQASEAVQKAALAQYEKAVQSAFGEVEDSLAALQKGQERLQAVKGQLSALERYLHLAKLRYQNGYTSYLEVVDAERNLFNTELTHAQNQANIILSLIDLYKAMGGGWVADET